MPLGSVADIDVDRTYAAVKRVNGHRTVTVTGDIDVAVANAAELMQRFESELVPSLLRTTPR